MSSYAVHVVLDPLVPGQTNEATREAATWDQALEIARHVPEQFPGWRCVSILPIADFLAVMDGATVVRLMPDETPRPDTPESGAS